MKSNAIAGYYQELKRNTFDPARLEKINKEEQENQKAYKFYVDRTIKKGKIPIRFAVYGSSGEFLGYKADSFWALHEAFAKIHPLEDADELLKSFAFCKNKILELEKKGKQKIKIESLEVRIEELDSKEEPVKVVGKYQVYPTCLSSVKYKVRKIK